MTDKQSFYAKVSRFFESYITIPKDTYYYEQNGSLIILPDWFFENVIRSDTE